MTLAVGWVALRELGATTGSAQATIQPPPDPTATTKGLVAPAGGDANTRETAAAPGAQALEPNGIAGRVIDGETGSGLGGCWAALWRPPDLGREEREPALLAGTRSGEDGRFVLPAQAPANAWIDVEPPGGWRVLEPRLPAARALEFRARRARSAPFRAVLIDQWTGELVPHCWIALRIPPSWSRIDASSDASGQVATDLALEEGQLAVELVDDPRIERGRGDAPPLQQVLHAAEENQAPVELRVPVGPTFRLDLRLPAGLEPKDLHAVLSMPGERSLEREASYRRIPLRLDPEGGLPWVRFPANSTALVVSEPNALVVLAVRDQPCEHRGAASVRAAWGIHPAPVTVALGPAARLDVEVLDGRGDAVQGAFVALHDDAGVLEVSSSTDASGRARFTGLPPGEYRARATHRQFLAIERALRLPAGVSEVRLALGRAAVAGAIEGRVVYGPQLRGRRWGTSPEIHLVAADGAERRFSLPLSFEDEGPERSVARFRFEEVPAGTYVCAPSLLDPRAMWPHAIEVSPPAAGLEFAELPAGTLMRVAIEVVAAEDGAPMPGGRLWVSVRGDLGPTDYGSPRLGPWVHPDAELDWGAGAAGRKPRFGHRAQLAPRGAELAGRAELERGFGLRLELADPSGAPLQGVAVLIDGTSAGATGADGRLMLEGEAPPRELRLEHADWREPDDLAERLVWALEWGAPQLALALQPR